MIFRCLWLVSVFLSLIPHLVHKVKATTTTSFTTATTTSSTTTDSSCSAGQTIPLYSCPKDACGATNTSTTASVSNTMPEYVLVKNCLRDCPRYTSTHTDTNWCIDRKLFSGNQTQSEYVWHEVLAALVWFLTAGVAISCGVGGTGVYLPLGELLLLLSPQQAVGLAQISGFGTALGGLILNIRNRHPVTTLTNETGQKLGNRYLQKTISSAVLQSQHKISHLESADHQPVVAEENIIYYTRPLIHYDLVLYIIPLEVVGSVLGVLIRTVSPSWFNYLVGGFVLSFTAIVTYHVYFQARRKETAQKALAKHQQQCSDQDALNVVWLQWLHRNSGHVQGNGTPMALDQGEESTASRLRERYMEEDMQQYPPDKIATFLVLWMFLFLFTALQGGKGLDSIAGISCESVWFGVFIALHIALMLGYGIYIGRQIVHKQKARDDVMYAFLPDDPILDIRTVEIFGIGAFLAGIVTGLLSINAGMVRCMERLFRKRYSGDLRY